MEIYNNLRRTAIDNINGNEISEKDKKIVKDFLKYLDAFCVDLNYTEFDVLLNDENYEMVFGLFDNVILKKSK
jgi:hypothetical protein